LKLSQKTRDFVECNGIKKGNENTTIIPTNKANACNAVSERGYTFNSWSGLVESDENPLKFNSSAYGNIIAHFKPTLSYEQYVFIIGGVTGISSVLLGWFFKGRQRRKFNKFVRVINQTVGIFNWEQEGGHNPNWALRRNIFNSYRSGSLTDFQFDYLGKRIVNYIDKIEKI